MKYVFFASVLKQSKKKYCLSQTSKHFKRLVKEINVDKFTKLEHVVSSTNTKTWQKPKLKPCWYKKNVSLNLRPWQKAKR